MGLPGSEPYADALSRLAQAGGTARDGPVAYYQADDANALAGGIREIAVNISISCTIELDEAPPDWGRVNLYFDERIVAASETDGWEKVDEKTLEVVGPACTWLKSGDVFQAQVVAGCPTVLE